MRNLFAIKGYKLYLFIPLILFLICLLAVFIYPRITLGLDFVGGTRYIIATDAPINEARFESILLQKYKIEELQVSTTSSVLGNRVKMEFKTITQFKQAETLLNEAEAVLTGNPVLAKTDAEKALKLIQEVVPGNVQMPSDAKEAVDFAAEKLIAARLEFKQQVSDILVKEFKLSSEPQFEIGDVQAVLGEAAWSNALVIASISMLFIVIIVLFFFRKIIPSFAIIASATFDISMALAGMAVFSIPLSLGTIPALLMLIGYSVDTDIMLTFRLLKRKDSTPADRTLEAFKTGLTMTTTTIVAVCSMLVVSFLIQMVVIFDIAAVLLCGLIGDLIGTWLMNAPMLLWYVEKGIKSRVL